MNHAEVVYNWRRSHARPYAAYYNGDALCNARGGTRLFASEKAAAKAIEKAHPNASMFIKLRIVR